jgi:hypothetical protein
VAHVINPLVDIKEERPHALPERETIHGLADHALNFHKRNDWKTQNIKDASKQSCAPNERCAKPMLAAVEHSSLQLKIGFVIMNLSLMHQGGVTIDDSVPSLLNTEHPVIGWEVLIFIMLGWELMHCPNIVDNRAPKRPRAGRRSVVSQAMAFRKPGLRSNMAGESLSPPRRRAKSHRRRCVQRVFDERFGFPN